MAYENKNVIVGAAALFVSAADSTQYGTGSKWYNAPVGGVASPVGPSLPNFGTAKAEVALNASADWRHVGYTSDGVEVSYEPEFGDVVVDQALDAVKIFKQGMKVSVRTTLSEPTLENLVLTWGQQSNTLSAEAAGVQTLGVSGGSLGEDPVERSLAFVGPGPTVWNTSQNRPEKKERVYHIRRALQVESSAHSLSRQDATNLPVSFRCLPDSAPSLSGRDYGIIVQRTVV